MEKIGSFHDDVLLMHAFDFLSPNSKLPFLFKNVPLCLNFIEFKYVPRYNGMNTNFFPVVVSSLSTYVRSSLNLFNNVNWYFPIITPDISCLSLFLFWELFSKCKNDQGVYCWSFCKGIYLFDISFSIKNSSFKRDKSIVNILMHCKETKIKENAYM